eukprot:CAMPEP_0115506342 /NCGR_PEP_ID=MMETSP0271-20121206/71098_1 /TAXON_ID=71861 /ORGANISM="Scrippsiella trochoidea, Strain CCMP3099" /LENGTH=137 /DNA_ID=CAMNT_0002935773 /DNA_START=204 /DNA_END=617 /DNA_ORIENTATION=+
MSWISGRVFSDKSTSLTLTSTHPGWMPNSCATPPGCVRFTETGMFLQKSMPRGFFVKVMGFLDESWVLKVNTSAPSGTATVGGGVAFGATASAPSGSATGSAAEAIGKGSATGSFGRSLTLVVTTLTAEPSFCCAQH